MCIRHWFFGSLVGFLAISFLAITGCAGSQSRGPTIDGLIGSCVWVCPTKEQPDPPCQPDDKIFFYVTRVEFIKLSRECEAFRKAVKDGRYRIISRFQ